jgi:hypothetical protein
LVIIWLILIGSSANITPSRLGQSQTQNTRTSTQVGSAQHTRTRTTRSLSLARAHARTTLVALLAFASHAVTCRRRLCSGHRGYSPATLTVGKAPQSTPLLIPHYHDASEFSYAPLPQTLILPRVWVAVASGLPGRRRLNPLLPLTGAALPR